MKKTIAFFLCFIMLTSLAACAAPAGKTDETLPEKQAEEPNYTYTPRFVELGGMENYLMLRCCTQDGFYATAGVMVSNTIPAGVTPEYESQYYQYEQRLYFIALDGTVRRLRSYKPLVIDNGRTDILQYTQANNIASMLIDDSGALTVLEAVDEGWYKKIVSASGKVSYGDYVARQRWFIRSLDDSGAEISRCEVKLEDEEWLDGYKAVTDGSGALILIDRSGIRGVDAKGDTIWHIDTDAPVGNVIKGVGGSPCVMSWGDRWSAKTVDITTGTLSGGVELPMKVYSVSAGLGQTLLYTEGNRLYSFDTGTGESWMMLNWLDCDINVETVSNLTALENGDLAGTTTVFDDRSGSYITELFILERGTENKNSKQSISFGTAELDSELRGLIIAHNRSGEGKRIEIRDYSQYEDGAAKLTEDIRAGKAPDIIDLKGLDVPTLAAEGYFEDLYTYIDADGELDRADYFENLLKSCEWGGALISSCPGFYISTLIGAESVVGAKTSWSFEDFQAAAQGMAPESSILEYYSTRDEVLAECLALCYDELINSGERSCNFQTQLFTDILRFAALFPAKYNWDSFTGDADDSTYFRLKTGRQMLTRVNIYSPQDIFACDADFEGDASFIGYPVAEGTGSGLVRQWGLAISAKSGGKDEAWQFIRPFFTEDYQKSFWGIPALKTLFDRRLEEAMTTEYYTDAEGEAILDDDGQPIPKSRADFGDKERKGDSVERFYAVTPAQAERLRGLIDAAERTFNYDEGLFKLVRDKTTAYFAGNLSAEEASAVVQGAVTKYLREAYI